jgi:molybdopterin molybdotransferase
MISVEEALAHVGRSARRLATTAVPLREALGLRLAEAVESTLDSPPFDKSMLDGYAIRVDDPAPTRRIVAEVIAGDVPRHAVGPGTTVRLMTGAPVPDGADAVVKHEETRLLDDATVELPDGKIAPGAGIMLRGSSFHAGQQVLEAGRWLTPIDLGLLAEIGRDHVPVTPRPRVAVLATGNELVECGEPVAVGQIRNSNGPMLLAALEEMRVATIDLGIGRDDREILQDFMRQGLDADVLLVTGGVSAGVMDLVPGVLAELGVAEVFHKVRMKPGKPLWFGTRERDARRTLVFGLPGNPVSTLVSWELFVKPALRVLAGEEFSTPRTVRGVLTEEVNHRGERPTYNPCKIDFGRREAGQPTVEPLAWRGSADLAALTRANALAVLPAGDYQLAAGQEVDVISLSPRACGR